MENTSKKKNVSPYLIVLLSLVGVILMGSLLLTLPFSHQDGQWGRFLDSLFVSTSATCVTGLCTYEAGLAGELTLFGQVIVLLMIQIGGLGFITILTFIISLLVRRLKFKDRLFLSQAINSTTIADVVKFARRVILIVIVAELIGFLLGLPVFLNMKGLSTGEAIWKCLFTSISAFNNAGFDLFGNTSLVRGIGNPFIDSLNDGLYYYLLSYLMLLIIFGGLSFVVIIEIFFNRKKIKHFNAFTKIVLLSTCSLLILGTLAFTLTDVINGNMNFFHAIFQSVTTRTAGFASVDQNTLSNGGKTISCLWMFIGGSPISTAGGIKTTTMFIIVLSFVCFLKGKRISAFNREFSRTSIIKAMSLVFFSLLLIVISFITIDALEGGNEQATTINTLFEIFSAFGTTGLSAGITTTLTVGSKLIICLLMFFGRLGPFIIFQIFENNMDQAVNMHYKKIETDIIIG